MADLRITALVAPGPAALLEQALSKHDTLTPKDRALLHHLPFRVRAYGRGHEIIVAGSRPSESCLIVSGFTARAVQFDDGSRQLTGMQVTGDFIDLHAFLLRQIDHSVIALTPCIAGFTPHAELRRLVAEAPHLTRMLWLTTVIDAAVQRTWVANFARRTSLQHLAHFVCELYRRLEGVGVARDHQFDFPVSQQQLSEVLGLSVVHMNRTIQKLRRSGLVIWKANRISILDLKGLVRLAAFDPTYLSLSREPR